MEKRIDRISIDFRIPNKPEKRTLSLLNIVTGIRYPTFKLVVGEIYAGHLTVDDIKHLEAYVKFENVEKKCQISQNASQPSFLYLSTDKILIKIFYREVHEILDEIEEEYLNIKLKGFLWVRILPASQRYDFSLEYHDQIRYKISSARDLIVKFPIYFNKDIKLKLDSKTFILNLGNKPNSVISTNLIYSWEPQKEQNDKKNINLKIYYYSKSVSTNNLYYAIASFCFYESIEDKSCNSGFSKFKFSSSHLYKIPLDMKISLENNKNYYIQILIRTSSALTINPPLKIVEALLYKQLIYSESSFQICFDIHCFIFNRESVTATNKKLSVFIRMDKRAGFCLHSDSLCFKKSTKFSKKPRKSTNMKIYINDNNKYILFFILKSYLTIPIILKRSQNPKNLMGYYKYQTGPRKIRIFKFIFKSEERSNEIRNDEYEENSCLHSLYNKLYPTLYYLSIVFFILGSIITVLILVIVIRITISQRTIYINKDFNRSSKYYRPT